MAARRNPVIDAAHRERIQTTQLVKRLTGHALGDVAMESTQVKAIEILLRKSLPDLASVAHTGPGGGKLVIGWEKGE